MGNKKVYTVCEEYFVEEAGSDHISYHTDRLVRLGVYESKDMALEMAKKYFDKKVSTETNKFSEFFKVDSKEYIHSYKDDDEYTIEVKMPAWSSGLGGDAQTWTYYVMQLDVLEELTDF